MNASIKIIALLVLWNMGSWSPLHEASTQQVQKDLRPVSEEHQQQMSVRANAKSNTTLTSAQILKVIPKPPEDTRLVLKLNTGTVIIIGQSTLDLLCGNCNTLLAKGVAPGQFPDIVLYCNNCGSFNDTEDCVATNR